MKGQRQLRVSQLIRQELYNVLRYFTIGQAFALYVAEVLSWLEIVPNSQGCNGSF